MHVDMTSSNIVKERQYPANKSVYLYIIYKKYIYIIYWVKETNMHGLAV